MLTIEGLRNMADYITDLQRIGQLTKYQEIELLQRIDLLTLLDSIRKLLNDKLNDIIEKL